MSFLSFTSAKLFRFARALKVMYKVMQKCIFPITGFQSLLFCTLKCFFGSNKFYYDTKGGKSIPNQCGPMQKKYLPPKPNNSLCVQQAIAGSETLTSLRRNLRPLSFGELF
ncbi:hypothetical protein XENOCAPTIV_011327 [Xenoophorus captivus]|uniref:Uncharacterized protein n=1 Tax=Xenoophorus captivus TaxID=1517983 RepID=A0ABV0RY54_9TELE